MRKPFLGALLALVCLAAQAQPPHDPKAAIAAQREALAPLARLDGLWRGTAWTMQRDGSRLELVQTERVGSMLDA